MMARALVISLTILICALILHAVFDLILKIKEKVMK